MTGAASDAIVAAAGAKTADGTAVRPVADLAELKVDLAEALPVDSEADRRVGLAAGRQVVADLPVAAGRIRAGFSASWIAIRTARSTRKNTTACRNHCATGCSNRG